MVKRPKDKQTLFDEKQHLFLDCELIMIAPLLLSKPMKINSGMTDCNPNRHPAAAAAALGIDPDGLPYKEKWTHHMV